MPGRTAAHVAGADHDGPLMLALVFVGPLVAAPVLVLVWLASYLTLLGLYAA